MKQLNVFDLGIKNEIEELVREITKHDLLYAMEKPEISDTEYDKLYSRLVKLEEEYPHLVVPNSPTQVIVDIKIEGFEKVTHKHPILSQQKVYNDEEVIEFVRRVRINGVKYIVVQHKIDGLTIVLDYDENGVFKRGTSRGNGIEGFDITHLVQYMDTVPKRLKAGCSAQIRGEGVIFKEDFQRINEELRASGEIPFASARNLASGTMRSLEGKVAKERCVQFIAFDVLECEKGFENDIDALEFLKEEGFNVVDSKIFEIDNTDSLLEYLNNFNDTIRPTLDFTIDGMVLKIDDFKARLSLGETSKYPRWACAFKFEAEEVETKLIKVVWQVGRTGAITPVGIINPTEIDGRTVNRASLANADNIREKDLMLNDSVKIRFAGEVIPQITGCIPEDRCGDEIAIEIPKVCPICGEPTTINVEIKKGKETTKVTCENKNCLARTETKLIHFASKDNMNIEKFGDSLIIRLIDLGLLEGIEDIYKLKDHRDTLISLDRLGKKSVDTFLSNIELSKNAPLNRVLSALGIPNIGTKKAKVVANHFETMDNILEFIKKPNRKDVLLQLEDFGDIVSESFLNFFDNEDNLKLVKNLQSLGLTMTKEVIVLSEDLANANTEKIEGKTFVITGTLSIKRPEMKAKIEALGGKVVGSVSNNTDYLLLGSDKEGSSKHKKALSLNIPIISEEEFNKML